MITRTTIKVPIEYLPVNKERVPLFLPPLYEFLKSNVCTVGIFRVPGDHKKVMILNESLSQHVPILPSDTSVHDAASFLKLWLRELPIPLIQPQLISTYFVGDVQNSMRDVLFHMPIVTRKTLAHVFSLLKDVLENQEENQMNFSNLSSCFFTSLTQNLKDIPEGFPFKSFFNHCLTILNPNGTDFLISTPSDVISIMATPKARPAKTLMTALQRKNLEKVGISEE